MASNRHYSATEIGRRIGKTAEEVNWMLYDLGYLTGRPGKWRMTEVGKTKGYESSHGNGYGGYAERGWGYPMWKEEVIYELGDPDAHLREVNRTRERASLWPLKSWDDRG